MWEVSSARPPCAARRRHPQGRWSASGAAFHRFRHRRAPMEQRAVLGSLAASRVLKTQINAKLRGVNSGGTERMPTPRMPRPRSRPRRTGKGREGRPSRPPGRPNQESISVHDSRHGRPERRPAGQSRCPLPVVRSVHGRISPRQPSGQAKAPVKSAPRPRAATARGTTPRATGRSEKGCPVPVARFVPDRVSLRQPSGQAKAGVGGLGLRVGQVGASARGLQ